MIRPSEYTRARLAADGTVESVLEKCTGHETLALPYRPHEVATVVPR